MSPTDDKSIDLEWLRPALLEAAEDLGRLTRERSTPREFKREARPLLAEIFRWDADEDEARPSDGLALLRRADFLLGQRDPAERDRFGRELAGRLERLWPISIPCIYAREIGLVAQQAEAQMDRQEERVDAVLATLQIDVEGVVARQVEVNYGDGPTDRGIVEKRGRK